MDQNFAVARGAALGSAKKSTENFAFRIVIFKEMVLMIGTHIFIVNFWSNVFQIWKNFDKILPNYGHLEVPDPSGGLIVQQKS